MLRIDGTVGVISAARTRNGLSRWSRLGGECTTTLCARMRRAHDVRVQRVTEGADAAAEYGIGVTFQATGSFVGPLMYIAVVALVGALAYSVILGDIHRLDVDTD